MSFDGQPSLRALELADEQPDGQLSGPDRRRMLFALAAQERARARATSDLELRDRLLDHAAILLARADRPPLRLIVGGVRSSAAAPGAAPGA
jgi:hypothetical protein